MNVDLAKIAAAVKDRAEQAWKFADTKWEEIAKVAIDEYRRQLAEGNAGKTPGQVAADAYMLPAACHWDKYGSLSKQIWERAALAVLATFGGKGSPAQQEADEPECPHDETDHGICLSCGKQTDPNAPKFDTGADTGAELVTAAKSLTLAIQSFISALTNTSDSITNTK